MKLSYNSKNFFIFLFLLSLIIVFSLIFVNSKTGTEQFKIGQEYQNILNEFDKGNEWVSVSITLISSESKALLVNSLSEEEFILSEGPSTKTSVFGKVTKEGLEKLTDSLGVSSVHIQEFLSPTLSQSVEHIGVDDYVWNLGYTGEGQTICVIDSGVNTSHPDLSGKVLAEKCYCRNPEGNNSYCCPDGTLEDDDAEDTTGHGTHVSGILVSQDSTYKGVAPDANIVVVKVCNSSTTNSCNSADIELAIDWCVNNADTYNISVITMSLAGGIYAPGSCTPTYAEDEIALILL